MLQRNIEMAVLSKRETVDKDDCSGFRCRDVRAKHRWSSPLEQAVRNISYFATRYFRTWGPAQSVAMFNRLRRNSANF
jgi:hypothetical protein